uniref:Ig-like domain-containing protein n=1 Tax=Chelydra serpentina TaxID=8475 RepID=A0A8C3T146_CHESE
MGLLISLGPLVLSLTASEEGIQILQSPAQVWLTSGESAQLDCSPLRIEWGVMWYKEQQSGSLQWIYESSAFATSNGKYSSKVNITANRFSLIIHNAQTNDSGVYYCGRSTFVYLQPNFGNGTKLTVTDAAEPSLSILVPSILEDAELPPVIPLLCLLSDFTPPWSAVLWDTGEQVSEGPMDAGAIDGNGVFSVWSLTTIPSETWKQETICNCTAKESSTGRSISVTVSKETGPAAIKSPHPHSSLLQTKQAQFPQPLLVSHVPQPPVHFRCPPLDSFSLEVSQRGITREGNPQREQQDESQEWLPDSEI